MDISILLAKKYSGNSSKFKWVKTHFPNEFSYILQFSKLHNLQDLKFNQQVWHVHNNIFRVQQCEIENCENTVNFSSLAKGYSRFCCRRCQAKSPILKKKKEETNLQRYGCKYAWNNAKQKITIFKKYGVDNISKLKSVKEQKKNTTLKNFGVQYPMQSNIVKQTLIKNNNAKYDVDFFTQSEEFKNKSRLTSQLLYNVDNSSQSKEAIQKRKRTLLQKYAVDNYSKSNAYKQTIRDKWINFWKNKIKLEYPEFKFISFEFGQTKLSLQCDKNHKFEISSNMYNLRKIKKHNICTECNPVHKNTSFFEDEIALYVQSLGCAVLRNIKKIIKGELDIYIPSLNIAIECNGIYYHSERFRDDEYHFNKYLRCHEKEIKLIQIWEDDWHLKQNIIKSNLANILHKTAQNIFAKDCIIKNINSNIYRHFIEINHIQEYKNCKYKIGLFYNNELVSIMCFSKNKNNIKLEIFCDKLNTAVVGAASKLFKFALKTYDFNSIIVYTDLDCGYCNLYKKLGFQFKSYTKTTYYLSGGKKHNINETQKESLKIYGSGSAKWIYFS